MHSNPEIKLMTKLLNLDGMRVKNYRFLEGIGVSLYIEDKARAVPCPDCGQLTNKLHQNH
jgi:hypothetical protein